MIRIYLLNWFSLTTNNFNLPKIKVFQRFKFSWSFTLSNNRLVFTHLQKRRERERERERSIIIGRNSILLLTRHQVCSRLVWQISTTPCRYGVHPLFRMPLHPRSVHRKFTGFDLHAVPLLGSYVSSPFRWMSVKDVQTSGTNFRFLPRLIEWLRICMWSGL